MHYHEPSPRIMTRASRAGRGDHTDDRTKSTTSQMAGSRKSHGRHTACVASDMRERDTKTARDTERETHTYKERKARGRETETERDRPTERERDRVTSKYLLQHTLVNPKTAEDMYDVK